MTSKITPDQALKLVALVGVGSTVGVTADGDIVVDTTKFSDALHLFGKSIFAPLPRNNGIIVWRDTSATVAFLREWADALEEAGK